MSAVSVIVKDSAITVESARDDSIVVTVYGFPPLGTPLPDGGTTRQVLAKGSNVDGDAGWIDLVKSDVGLGNVDNTSDADKPVSTATQTALNNKSNLGHTHTTTEVSEGTNLYHTSSRVNSLIAAAVGSVTQAWSATLDSIAALATTVFGRSLLTLSTPLALRTAARLNVAVINPRLPRSLAKVNDMFLGTAGTRLNWIVLGDSKGPYVRETMGMRMNIETINGGVAGRLAGENGWYDDGNGTNATQITGDYTTSPIGIYWDIAPGGSKYWRGGALTSDNPLTTFHPTAGLLPTTCTRVGVWYIRYPGGGVMKVQTSTKGSGEGTYADVTGMTAIDTNGALSVQYLEVAIASRDVARVRIVHVSGAGNVRPFGALCGADIGFYLHSWQAGGAPMTALIASPRWSEMWATYTNALAGGADLVMACFADSPGDNALSVGLTMEQLINTVLEGIRAAFPSTTIPYSITPWNGKTPAIAARPPDFAWISDNLSQTGAANTVAGNAAMQEYAVTNGHTFLDMTAIWPTWLGAWDAGVMSPGDGSGSSGHARIFYYTAVTGEFLRQTGMIAGWFSRVPSFVKADKLQVGPTAPALSNAANRFKVGNGISVVSMGPLDRVGFGDIAMMIESSASVFECGIMFRSTAASGHRISGRVLLLPQEASR